jgi:hypothetical protein
MSDQLTYLYTDGSRYWYDTRPTVNRMAQDRAQNIHPDSVYQEALERLRAVKYRREDFAAVHIAPQSSEDVADESRARLVVLDPDKGHRKNNGQSEAQRVAREILENRGNALRIYRNVLVFLAPDADAAEGWKKAIREYLAWKSIKDEADPLNLDAQQRKQVDANCKRTEETLLARLQETYSWLIVPVQLEPTSPIEYQAHRIPGQDDFYERAARKLRQSQMLISRWSPDNLRMELDRYLWRDQPHVELKQLWEYLARYCYLPRLCSEDVLLKAVEEGVARPDAPFGYATMVGLDGVYKGLTFGQPASNLYFDDKSVLVRHEIAKEQMHKQGHQTVQPPPMPASEHFGVSALPSTPSAPKLTTRYHGTVALDPQRINKEMSLIVEEIIQRLTGLTGTDVEITLEISAQRPSGFDDVIVRTISENSRTLKFKSHGFE